jgi:hypothetical protein
VLPIARLRIYDQSVTHDPSNGPASRTMSSNLDMGSGKSIAVSMSTGTAAVDTNQTHPLEPERNHSNLRNDQSRGETDVSLPAQRPSPSQRGRRVEQIGIVLARRQRGRPDEDYQVLQTYLADMARELGDRAPLRASTTRAYNLYKRAGVSRAVMIERLFTARAILKDRASTSQHQANPHFKLVPTRNRAAYFFAVLEDVLGLRPS